MQPGIKICTIKICTKKIKILTPAKWSEVARTAVARVVMVNGDGEWWRR